jgi:hypothetical protein
MKEHDPMRQIMGPITFIIILALSSNADAATSKCTGTNGKVIYTSTDCPPGYKTKGVEENVSVVDSSAERALIAKELEKAKTQAIATSHNGNEIASGDPATGGLAAANLASLADAESLAQTAITARERLWLATIILIFVAAIFLYIFRRKK